MSPLVFLLLLNSSLGHFKIYLKQQNTLLTFFDGFVNKTADNFTELVDLNCDVSSLKLLENSNVP